MRLCKRYLETHGTAGYFSVQAGHRGTAISLAIGAVSDLPNDPHDVFLGTAEALRQWTIEAVFQGAWMREYHHWETDTKAYFEAMHVRNSSVAPKWRTLSGSHVQKVRSQLAAFSVPEPTSLSVIDQMRGLLNDTKHDGGYLANAQDYNDLTNAVTKFWDDLNEQEEVDYNRR